MNRLEVEQWFGRFPEIDDQQICAPLFGLGLPRTGSTALSYLLAQDPARRYLRVWEADTPCPPPETGTQDSDPRIATAQAGIDFTNEMFPGFAGMLPSEATGPQECLLLMALDFRSLIFDGMAYVPSYTRWLMQCDMVPAYRYHERVLKLLQWRCPPYRWWLKTPAHMLSIDALNTVYPDARFVMTHRDIGKVLPSVCALYSSLSSILTERLDATALGAHSREVWSTALGRLIDFRDRGNEKRFHDLSFDEVQRDPIGEVTRLYRRSATSSATRLANVCRIGGPRARGIARARQATRPTDSASTRGRSRSSSPSTTSASAYVPATSSEGATDG